ncbi:MAG TPA: metal-dependent transcriptional regulator [Mogibacterium sp.]|nr:metal-dependent transcriptional regulator [Mogibacterium sp.]
MKINQSTEDYLETMLILQKEKGYIRSVDIAERMGVTKPSVSYAARKLRESGYINMEPNGPIVLTPPGLELATRVYERHQALEKFLILLGVEKHQAAEDACLIEHVISNDTFLAVKRYVEEHSE